MALVTLVQLAIQASTHQCNDCANRMQVFPIVVFPIVVNNSNSFSYSKVFPIVNLRTRADKKEANLRRNQCPRGRGAHQEDWHQYSTVGHAR